MTWNFFKEILLASEIKNNKLQELYDKKTNQILAYFLAQKNSPSHPAALAKGLFGYLWGEKPLRYRPHGNYRLNAVIDAQLSSDVQAVGNCLGLTLLYNCLLRKLGVVAKALYLDSAFDRGPHVLTLLSIGDTLIDVENILPEGFDYPGHRDNPSREVWGDQELVADIYLSTGNQSFLDGAYGRALKNYDQALELNPRNEKAHINKMILLDIIKKRGSVG
jgi:hypothetical protein